MIWGCLGIIPKYRWGHPQPSGDHPQPSGDIPNLKTGPKRSPKHPLTLVVMHDVTKRGTGRMLSKHAATTPPRGTGSSPPAKRCARLSHTGSSVLRTKTRTMHGGVARLACGGELLQDGWRHVSSWLPNFAPPCVLTKSSASRHPQTTPWG